MEKERRMNRWRGSSEIARLEDASCSRRAICCFSGVEVSDIAFMSRWESVVTGVGRPGT